jgi:hypothetical protein
VKSLSRRIRRISEIPNGRLARINGALRENQRGIPGTRIPHTL